MTKRGRGGGGGGNTVSVSVTIERSADERYEATQSEAKGKENEQTLLTNTFFKQ